MWGHKDCSNICGGMNFLQPASTHCCMLPVWMLLTRVHRTPHTPPHSVRTLSCVFRSVVCSVMQGMYSYVSSPETLNRHDRHASCLLDAPCRYSKSSMLAWLREVGEDILGGVGARVPLKRLGITLPGQGQEAELHPPYSYALRGGQALRGVESSPLHRQLQPRMYA